MICIDDVSASDRLLCRIPRQDEDVSATQLAAVIAGDAQDFRVACESDERYAHAGKGQVFGEVHLRQILSSYAMYYNEVRTTNARSGKEKAHG